MSVGQNEDLVDRFLEFYRIYYDDREDSRSAIGELAQRFPKEQESLTIDYQDLYQFDSALADDLIEQPETILEYAEEALALYDLPVDINLEGASVRVENLPDSVTFDVGEYRTEDVNRLLSVRGQVNKKTEVRGRIVEAAFECQRCGLVTRIPQHDGGSRQEPHECQGCERQGPFRIDWKQCVTVDNQLIRVQLPPERAKGQSQSSIDVTLEGDLVESVDPGDRVAVNTELNMELKDNESALFDFVGEANSVEIQETDFEDIDYHDAIEEIEAIAADNPLEKIANSIAPTIKGYETIKQAIGLQMFGGTTKQLPDGSTERGDSHILLVGDPGVGKSVMLSYADEMAPRSIYTDGKGSTSAGLTASAVRDDFGEGGWTIEGGSIVKAHRGLACIDELDDMDEEDRSALNTALEKQQVPVSKAGITATLPAKTTLLAAANPKHSRFDIYEPISEQINLDPALISRFDLIFTMTDVPEEQKDKEIIRHKTKTALAGQKIAAGDDLDKDLKNDVAPEIEPELMRKWIAYAKQEVTPVFSEEALERIEEVFFNFRMANASAQADPEDRPVPVTFRKQEALHRLSEASARVRLSDRVEVEDVDRVAKMIEKSLRDVGMDPETGELDADVVESGSSQSQRERLKYIKEAIAELAKATENGAPVEELMEVGREEGFTELQLEHGIDKLKNKGEIYESHPDHLRVSPL